MAYIYCIYTLYILYIIYLTHGLYILCIYLIHTVYNIPDVELCVSGLPAGLVDGHDHVPPSVLGVQKVGQFPKYTEVKLADVRGRRDNFLIHLVVMSTKAR